MVRHNTKGSLMLMTTALIWGTAFVAQKSGMDLVSPVAFNGIRTLVGGIALIREIAGCVIMFVAIVVANLPTGTSELPAHNEVDEGLCGQRQ